jgi:hypothetical protein
LHTGFVTITALTPGSSFLAASGLSYAPIDASPVPEPASSILLGSALTAATLQRIRRRRSLRAVR